MPNFNQLTRWQRLSMSAGVCAVFAFIQQPAIAISTATIQYPGGSASQTLNSGTASVKASQLRSSGYSAPTGQATASSAGTIRFGLQGTATYDPANPSGSMISASGQAQDTLFFHLAGLGAAMDVTFVFHGDGYFHPDPAAAGYQGGGGFAYGAFSIPYYSASPLGSIALAGTSGEFGNIGPTGMAFALLASASGQPVGGLGPEYAVFTADPSSGYVSTGDQSITFHLSMQPSDLVDPQADFAIQFRTGVFGATWGQGALDFMNTFDTEILLPAGTEFATASGDTPNVRYLGGENSVPDSGSTVALMGFSMVGLVWVGRRRRQS